MNLSHVYIDWVDAPSWATTAVLVFKDSTDIHKDVVVKEWHKPEELTVERARLEFEVRLCYKIHPTVIAKLSDQTLTDMMSAMDKKRKVKA